MSTRHPFHTIAALTMCLLLATSALAAPPDPSGHWSGEIDLKSVKLGVDIDLAAGPADATGERVWTGDISIPLQNAKDLPLGKIALAGADVTWVIEGVPGDPTFKGRLSDDGESIAGEMTQGGQAFPFTLKRAARPAEEAKGALDGFGAWVEDARKAWKVPGVAVAIVKEGEVVFSQGFGERDVEKHLPVTTHTLFAIGSATKAFTTFTMGTLVDEGNLDFDKPVTTWIPEFRMHDRVASERITPRDLVTHRSGLPRHDLMWYNSTLSRDQIVHRLEYLEPSKDFRTDFQYNNLMFMTAGYLVERITGKTWEEAVRERVLEPLGMHYSVFSWAEAAKAGEPARGYEERDDEVRVVEYREIPSAAPAGAINSCVEDMSQWVVLHLGDGKVHGKRLINAPTLADLHTERMPIGVPATEPEVQPGGYALGWFTDTYRGHARMHHGGNIDGFSALVSMLPADGIGVVVLTNMDSSALPGLVNRHACDRLLKLPARDWSAEALAKRALSKKTQKDAEAKKGTARKAGTKPAHALAEYAGEYEHPGYGVMKIELNNGVLIATYNGIVNDLEHWHYEVFNRVKAPKDHALDDQRLMFETGFDGEVTGLRAVMDPSVPDVLFVRKAEAAFADPVYLRKFAGDYELGPQAIHIELKGPALTAVIPGQPAYELAPTRRDRFDLKGLTGFSVLFVMDDTGAVKELQIIQPDGVYTATPKAAKNGK